MARQIGHDDDDLEALHHEDPGERFEPRIRAALRFAHAMADDAHAVSDDIFAELRRHYDEGQIIEIGCVVGLASYFNRLTAALRVDLSGSNLPYEEGPT